MINADNKMVHSAGLVFLAIFCFKWAPMQAQETAGQDYLWYDPAKIVTAEPCGECHQSEYQVWKKTKHATGFKTLHRKKSAERIAKTLGFKLIKRESLCLKCHYLGGIKGSQLRALSGVSCESCHGAAQDWINVHNDYGAGANYSTETAEHKAQRIAESEANGMFRPSTLYEVVANCFQCHTVPHERLVNVGGHSSGSVDFEFVARAEKTRHNFLQAQFDPTRTENAERSPERKRIMYVVGRAVDLEYSIRGAAAAKKKGRYLRGVERRIRSATNRLQTINSRANLPEITAMLAAVAKAEIKPENEAALLSLATTIGDQARRFLGNHDGTRLASLDDLMSGSAQPAPTETTETSTFGTRAGPKTDEGLASNRLLAQHKTIGPSCDCHDAAVQWWENDNHFFSAEPFKDREQENLRIAAAYGLSPEKMTKGTSVCMQCHGTVITEEISGEVFDGVSCESCHGPASAYRVPHSADDPPNGYAAGKDFGMRVLENVDAWAKACKQCHSITDPKLVAAGHSTGEDFDPVRASKNIQHWNSPTDIPTALNAAYEKTKRDSGPIPQVTATAPDQPIPARTPTTPEVAQRASTHVPTPQGVEVQPNKNYTQEPIKTGYVDAICLNVRAGAASSEDIVGHVFKGDPLEVYEVRGRWYRVSDAAGYLDGWVSGRYVSDQVVHSDFTIPDDYKGPNTPTIIENIRAKYVGVEACAACHSEPHAGLAMGPYGAWRDHFHSSAFRTLQTSYSKAFAKRRDIDDPTTDWRCVKCHVTAYGVQPDRLAPTYSDAQGVGCEACHGPGGDYLHQHYDANVDKNTLASMGFRIFSDLNERDRMCRACHNELSPTYKPFNVEAFSSAIRHWASEYTIEVSDDAPANMTVSAPASVPPRLSPSRPEIPAPPQLAAPPPPPSGSSTLGDPPADWMLGLQGPRKGPVFFPHKNHMEYVAAGKEAETCVVCHHKSAVGAIQGNCSASGCHQIQSTTVINRKKAMHDNCRICHRQEGAGPQRCRECHNG